MIWWVLSVLALAGGLYEGWKWLFGDRDVANGWDVCGECPYTIDPGERIGWNTRGEICHLKCL